MRPTAKVRLNLAKKTLLTCAAVAAIAAPLSVGLLIGIGHAPHLLAESRPVVVGRTDPAVTTPAQSATPESEFLSFLSLLRAPKSPVLMAQAGAPAPPPPPPPPPPPAGMCAVISPEAAKMEFDAASVKPSGLPTPNGPLIDGGPGSSDPSHVTMPRIPLSILIFTAYDLWSDQLEGPEWMTNITDHGFTISATMPATTTQEQYCGMLRNLLAERFHLTFHHETRARPGYELTVLPGGPKFKQYVPAQSGTSSGPPGTDANGFRVIPPDRPTFAGVSVSRSGLFRLSLRNNMGVLVRAIGNAISQTTGGTQPTRPLPRVADKTGLAGTWDIRLEYQLAALNLPNALSSPDGAAQAPTPEGPTIFNAVQQQLGLKLQKVRDVPVDVLVIDHVDQTPTEN